MHVHNVKPVHGWSEFLNEIVIIVIGVLIALSFEEVVSYLRDSGKRQEAADAVTAELRQNMAYLHARMQTQQCVERRLDEIGDLLGRAGAGPLPMQPKWVGQPSVWFASDEAWVTATGSGSASLFSPERQNQLSGIYVTTKRFVEAETREQDAWAQLRGLESWAGPLGETARVHFATALQSARYELWETRVAMEEAFRRAKTAGIPDAPARAQDDGYAVPHAVCLPIDTPREKALQILSKDTPPWGQPK